jgi:hypothetical protein
MIDNAVILFTTIMCLVVVFRAIKLDGTMPWFGDGVRRPQSPAHRLARPPAEWGPPDDVP